MDVQTSTDNSDDNEDNEPGNNTCKRQRKIYAPADAVRKEMTKQRQAKVLKRQQEKERAKAQAEANKEDIVPDDGEEPLGPDRIGFYTFFLEGQGNPPDLMGVDDDQLHKMIL